MENRPELLILSEEGYWEQPTWSRDPDDEVFIETGWQVRTYSGETVFRHNSLAPALNWLGNHGYVDQGDGAHFRPGASLASGK